MSKELLFTVTIKDCRVDYFRGSGKGGQKRNKTESGVRITHLASGSVGKSDDTRDQPKNKKIAFRRMAESRAFKAWQKIEIAKVTGKLAEVDEKVSAEMRRSKNFRVECGDGKHGWHKCEKTTA